MDPHSFYLLDLDPDLHSEKLLDPDPQKMNADPHPCTIFMSNEIITSKEKRSKNCMPGSPTH